VIRSDSQPGSSYGPDGLEDVDIGSKERAGRGCSEIFNTDQGSQFTSFEFVSLLQSHGIRISMDGKGCWRDNVFVERLWKTIKYEHVYLHAYESVSEARQLLTRYITFYNARRPHSSLDGQTPYTMYFKALRAQLAA
jgi:putative transposase